MNSPFAITSSQRVVAYALHPVGWAIDLLVLRPAHWLVHQEPLDEVIGHRH